MKRLRLFSLTLAFSFLATMIFAQVPDPSGSGGWDYCQCLDGVQSQHDVCPCAQTFPSGNTGGTGNTGGNTGGGTSTGTGGPGTSGTGTGGTLGNNNFWPQIFRDIYCQLYPDDC